MDHFWFEPYMGESWFTYPNLYKAMVEKFPSGSHFVEVGSWKGMSSAYMAVEIINSGKQIKFDCVDIWCDTKLEDGSVISGNKVKLFFLENTVLVKNAINVIHDDSVATAANYKDQSIDFVFIDGDHSYEGCLRDIKAWLPKVKPNGVIAGHDYAWWCDSVRLAVKEVFGEGDFSDPWNSGCFMIYLENGVPRNHSS